MTRTLIRQLERFTVLSLEEKLALRHVGTPLRRLPSRHDLAHEDEPIGVINMLVAGFACRYTVLPNGRRQILAYLLPGDFCDLRACVLERMDHCIGTLTAVKLASFSRASIADLARRFPHLARALALATATEEAVARQWLLNLGHRNALERTAHLLCELFTRLQAVGLTADGTCELPLTQADLADALALSPVHMNRTLMEMRRKRLATFSRHQLVIEDFLALQQVAGFKSRYLNAERQRQLFCDLRTAIEAQALADFPQEGTAVSTAKPAAAPEADIIGSRLGSGPNGQGAGPYGPGGGSCGPPP